MARQSFYNWCIENGKEELLNEWDIEKNLAEGLDPQKVGCKSTRYKPYWICSLGHSYQAYVANKIRGDGCSVCSDHQLLKDYNDLQFICPEICEEWDKQRNKEAYEKDIAAGKENPHPKEPTDLLWGSSIKVYWKCKKGHTSYLSPNERHVKRDGSFSMCNKCANDVRTQKKRETRAIKNNLAENVPQAVEEWVSSEHGLTPFDVSCNSKERVHWKCAKGHEFDKLVTERVYRKDGKFALRQCFECVRYAKTSIPEQIVFFYIRQVFPDAINPYKELGIELDIFIPSRKIAIEYDGSYAHKDRQKKDNAKDAICHSNDIVLYRFRPSMLPDTDYARRITVTETNAGVVEGLTAFFRDINETAPEMDLDKDYEVISDLFKDRIIVSVASTPLIAEWDLNNNITDPKYVSVKESHTAYNWICPICHKSYPAYPYNRYVRKTGHKECSDKNAVRHNKRKIKNKDTGEVFNSIADAERAYGKEGNTSISCCCRGRYHTAYGYHWCYYDESAEE